MFRKGSFVLVITAAALLSSSLLIFPDWKGVDGLDPEFSSYSITPEEPAFDDEINITATFDLNDETINNVQVQICHGPLDSAGTCDPPVDMVDSGDGSTFFYNIPPGGFGHDADAVFCYFHFLVDHTNGNFHYPADMGSDEINVTIMKKASMIEIIAEPDLNTVFPNETITVSGRVKNDLDENVSGAEVNLSVPGMDITNSTITNSTGHFGISTSIPSDGNYTLNITCRFDGMAASREWDVTVNSWPLPQMSIEGELSYDDGDRPPGETGLVFYTGSEVILTYRIRNLGTGDAENVTALINISNGDNMEVFAGNMTPTPTQRFENELTINTSEPGIVEINITLEWEQTAPGDLKTRYDPYRVDVEIREIPTWENHTVLVEMFTQTTCVPCVNVEEALERLHEQQGTEFELITYVYEDQASQLVMNELGVTSTPDVFIDRGFDRMSEGGNLEDLMSDLSSRIEIASARETPPARIEFRRTGEDLVVSLELSDMYDDQISGLFQVFSIESNSNIRNYQGIPIAKRYQGAVDGTDINGMNPGSTKNITLPLPEKGMEYTAVLFSQEGTVLNTGSYLQQHEERELYLPEGSDLVRITSPGIAYVNLTLERFQFRDEEFDDIQYDISSDGLPDNWTLLMNDHDISDNAADVEFKYGDSSSEVLPSTRVMYTDDISMDLEVPANADGTYSFDVIVNCSGYLYTRNVVVVATPEDDPDPAAPPEISDIYLEGVGKRLYLHIEAENVPEEAKVKGRILPCNYGEGAACGIPKDFLLIKRSQENYRASITGVDLETYTHLTYSGWIEHQEEQLAMTEERTVEISSLVDIPEEDENGETGDDDTDIFLISIGALFVGFILAVVLFVVLKKRQTPEGSGREEMTGEDERIDADEIKPSDDEDEPRVGSVDEDSRDIPPAPPAQETQNSGINENKDISAKTENTIPREADPSTPEEDPIDNLPQNNQEIGVDNANDANSMMIDSDDPTDESEKKTDDGPNPPPGEQTG